MGAGLSKASRICRLVSCDSVVLLGTWCFTREPSIQDCDSALCGAVFAVLWADLLCTELLLTHQCCIPAPLEPGCSDVALVRWDQAPSCSSRAATAACLLPVKPQPWPWPFLGTACCSAGVLEGVCRPMAPWSGERWGRECCD